MKGYKEKSGELVIVPELISAPCHTKIVCTLGTASSDEDTLGEMIAAGMDVARMDFSKGEHEAHREVFQRLRALSERWNNQVAIMCDIQGPRILTGKIESPFEINKGDVIRITPSEVIGNMNRIHITYAPLLNDLNKDDIIFLNDSLIKLSVMQKDEGANDLVCMCRVGGLIDSEQTCSIPSGNLTVDVLTSKDQEDLKLIAKLKPEFVTAPFCHHGDDVKRVRDCLKKHGNAEIKVIAKIERPVALENIDSIIEQADSIMITRGFLGEEMETWDMEKWQKLIKRCNRETKPVIVAVSRDAIHVQIDSTL
jgi:pyruvate kinase